MTRTPSPAAHPRLRQWLSRFETYRRHYQLDQHLRNLLAGLPEGLSEDQLDSLWRLWGDDLPTARMPYIRAAIAEARRCPGPILQCGASLSSMLIGSLCHHGEAPARHLWILEHDPHWANVIRSWLAQYEISNAHVISAPVEQFDGFVWYVVDPTRLPGNFGLVLCDASAALSGSARGVVSRLRDRLDHRCVILARNARRPKDLKVLADWARSRRAPFVIHDDGEPYVKIALRDQRSDAAHQQERLNTIYSKQARG